MKTSPLAVAGLIFLFLAGCRTDPSVTLLERQNRQLEDEVYRLRGMVQDSQDGGTGTNCSAVETVEAAPAASDMRKTRESTAAPGETIAPRGRKSSTRQAVPPPVVEMPGEALPSGDVPETLKRPAGTKTPGEPGKLESPETPKQWQEPSGPNLRGPMGTEKSGSGTSTKLRPAGGMEPVAKDDSKDVGQLVLNRMLTGGLSTDGKSGDSGVLAVVEPRDAKGRRLEAPGDVAVVLMDPSKTGPEAKLARWDFPASETAKLFRGSGVGRGMYVECPWPDKPPENNRLRLYVRYTTRDGRKLQADQSIEIALPGEKTARWTPSATEPQPVGAAESAPAAYQSEKSAATASRNNAAKLQRPVWSPERF